MEMAGDKVTKVQVVKEYLERTNAENEFDNIAALLPTCPFRTAEDVQSAANLFFENKENEFLIGVVEYEFPIQLALKKRNGKVVEMENTDGYLTTRSQNIEKKYHPNGAIYLASIKAFKRRGTFFNEKMLYYEMPQLRSFDIDYPYQFQIAEIIAKQISEQE